eukprot:gene19609-26292_t
MFDKSCFEFVVNEADVNAIAQHIPNTYVIDPEVIESLELVDVCNALDDTFIKGGHATLQDIIYKPVGDVCVLKARQSAMKELVDSYVPNRKFIDEQFKIMKDTEAIVLWFLQDRSSQDNALLDNVYFTNIVARNFNNVPALLTAYNLFKMVMGPVMSIVSPLLYIIVPFIMLRVRYKIPIGFSDFCRFVFNLATKQQSWNNGTTISLLFSLFVYGQNVFSAMEISKL